MTTLFFAAPKEAADISLDCGNPTGDGRLETPANVEFRQGYAEEMPVADGEVDVTISNCGINLTEDTHLSLE